MSLRKSWLPREGFHADVLGSLARVTILSPSLLLPLLLLAKYTAQGRQLSTSYPRSQTVAKILAALGTIRVLNAWLNRRILNNGTKDKFDLEKELVLVTGGSDGVGKHITLMFASQGVKVAVLDVQKLTYEAPPGVHFFQCDITSTQSLDKAATAIRTTVGEPTVLINNAAVVRGKPILESTDNDIQSTFAVNTMSHYKIAREFLPSMIGKNHGTVVTISSLANYITAPQTTDYSASKVAGKAFHEGLTAELVSQYNAPKVRTVLIELHLIRTGLSQGANVDNAFFGPSLYPETVAQDVVEQVMRAESAHRVLTGFHGLTTPYFRNVPTWMQHRARIQFADMMKNFKGRQVAPSPETS